MVWTFTGCVVTNSSHMHTASEVHVQHSQSLYSWLGPRLCSPPFSGSEMTKSRAVAYKQV